MQPQDSTVEQVGTKQNREKNRAGTSQHRGVEIETEEEKRAK